MAMTSCKEAEKTVFGHTPPPKSEGSPVNGRHKTHLNRWNPSISVLKVTRQKHTYAGKSAGTLLFFLPSSFSLLRTKTQHHPISTSLLHLSRAAFGHGCDDKKRGSGKFSSGVPTRWLCTRSPEKDRLPLVPVQTSCKRGFAGMPPYKLL